MQTTQQICSNAFPQAELARHMSAQSEQPLQPFALRGESVDAADLERVVELGYN